MLRRLQVFFSLPLALAFVFHILLTTSALAGLTLCIEVDGRIGIEAEKDDCCPPASGPDTSPSYGLEKGTCVTCIDVTLGDGNAGILSNSGSQSSETLPGSALEQERLLPFKIRIAPNLLRPSPAMSTMAAIQTVVLRV